MTPAAGRDSGSGLQRQGDISDARLAGPEVVMLTGDNERTARAIARQVGIDRAKHPQERLSSQMAAVAFDRLRQIDIEYHSEEGLPAPEGRAGAFPRPQPTKRGPGP